MTSPTRSSDSTIALGRAAYVLGFMILAFNSLDFGADPMEIRCRWAFRWPASVIGSGFLSHHGGCVDAETSPDAETDGDFFDLDGCTAVGRHGRIHVRRSTNARCRARGISRTSEQRGNPGSYQIPDHNSRAHRSELARMANVQEIVTGHSNRHS